MLTKVHQQEPEHAQKGSAIVNGLEYRSRMAHADNR